MSHNSDWRGQALMLNGKDKRKRRVDDKVVAEDVYTVLRSNGKGRKMQT